MEDEFIEHIRRKRKLEFEKLLDDEEEEMMGYQLFFSRDEPLYRRRWDSQYLLELAENEGSFVAEYRMQPSAFHCLCEMLRDSLTKVEVKQAACSARSGSKPISVMSRVGAALIILAGGRNVEVMRTHGVSMSFCYKNLQDVCAAINIDK